MHLKLSEEYEVHWRGTGYCCLAPQGSSTSARQHGGCSVPSVALYGVCCVPALLSIIVGCAVGERKETVRTL